MSKTIAPEELAFELKADVTRVDLSLAFKDLVLVKLWSIPGFADQCKGAFVHLSVSTLTHTFMTLVRMFDEPTSRFSVTLEQLVAHTLKQKPEHVRVQTEGAAWLHAIADNRKKLARLRNTVFAHRNYQERMTVVPWADLEKPRDVAKKIVEWHGSEFGQAHSFHVPGYSADCKRFLEVQQRGVVKPEDVGA